MSYVGDMLSLATFVNDHHEALVADFQREYAIDLDQAIEDGITANRMMALVNGIGPDSALYRDVNEDTWRWGIREELLATICELLDYGNRNFIMANSENPGRLDPITINRPGREEKPKGTTLAELIAMQAERQSK